MNFKQKIFVALLGFFGVIACKNDAKSTSDLEKIPGIILEYSLMLSTSVVKIPKKL